MDEEATAEVILLVYFFVRRSLAESSHLHRANTLLFAHLMRLAICSFDRN